MREIGIIASGSTVIDVIVILGIPRGFTREFVEEIEATLARNPDLDIFELETKFSSLNPQKQG